MLPQHLSEDEKDRLYRLLKENQIEAARYDFAQYARLTLDQEPARHHKLLIDALEEVEAGQWDLLLVMMPPGSAKSTYGSVGFAAWYLGKHPDRCVIAASHTQELAERFGRKVRNIVSGDAHTQVFPGSKLSSDSTAAGRWETSAGGEYFAAGVGGSVTGRRADLAIIDDPVKSREDADSQTIRDKQWAWWRDDMSTRLKPGASTVCIMCMTGDTPVLLPDGSEKFLRDIRPGDNVSSYKDGKLVASTVRNWINNGLDSVFEIKMSSGKIVKANARHPFLVSDNGEPKWVRLRDLRQGQEIFRVNGESGRARPASMKGAISQQNAEGIAQSTTTRFGGKKVLDLLRATAKLGARHALSIATVLRSKSTTGCLPNKTDDALSAVRSQGITSGRTGVESCVSTTVTKQGRSEGCSATTATWLLGTQRQKRSQPQPLSTSDFTLDRIVEISAAGVEEVFDIQVDDTENFIANGLVSHNTRWHEDDLAGRMLEDLKGSKQRVKVISLPMEARANDPLGRMPGEMLWPEWFTPQMLETAKREPRTWSALYQQEPRPIGGGEFKEEWLCFYKSAPATGGRVILVDPASGKYKDRGDYTSMWVIGTGQDGNHYVLDGIRDRLNLTERSQTLFDLVRRWKPTAVGYEQYGLQADIEFIKNEQERQQYRFRIVELGGAMKKEDRIRRLIPIVETGRLWLPEALDKRCSDGIKRDIIDDFIEQEYLSFPVSAHDDALDCLARMRDDAIVRVLRETPVTQKHRSEQRPYRSVDRAMGMLG